MGLFQQPLFHPALGRSRPNSTSSIRSGSIAAELTVTKGASARSELAWM
jgi:hypothetical protein